MSVPFPWGDALMCVVIPSIGLALRAIAWRIIDWHDRRLGIVPDSLGKEVSVTVSHDGVDRKWKLSADMPHEKARHVVRQVVHEILP